MGGLWANVYQICLRCQMSFNANMAIGHINEWHSAFVYPGRRNYQDFPHVSHTVSPLWVMLFSLYHIKYVVYPGCLNYHQHHQHHLPIITIIIIIVMIITITCTWISLRRPCSPWQEHSSPSPALAVWDKTQVQRKPNHHDGGHHDHSSRSSWSFLMTIITSMVSLSSDPGIVNVQT